MSTTDLILQTLSSSELCQKIELEIFEFTEENVKNHIELQHFSISSDLGHVFMSKSKDTSQYLNLDGFKGGLVK